MKKAKHRLTQQGERGGSTASSSDGKKRWQEPKLAFVKPKLTKHGKLEEVTAAFFGGFTPPRPG